MSIISVTKFEKIYMREKLNMLVFTFTFGSVMYVCLNN